MLVVRGGTVLDGTGGPGRRADVAVRKLTGELADLLGLARRGYLRERMHADLVVFDPGSVGPGTIRRVQDFPAAGTRLVADRPTGIAHILVNGTPITRDGTSLAGALDRGPGHVIRGTDPEEVRA